MRLVAIWLVGMVIITLIAACSTKREQMDWKALADYLDKQETQQ